MAGPPRVKPAWCAALQSYEHLLRGLSGASESLVPAMVPAMVLAMESLVPAMVPRPAARQSAAAIVLLRGPRWCPLIQAMVPAKVPEVENAQCIE